MDSAKQSPHSVPFSAHITQRRGAGVLSTLTLGPTKFTISVPFNKTWNRSTESGVGYNNRNESSLRLSNISP
jgi:hypothetical protein